MTCRTGAVKPWAKARTAIVAGLYLVGLCGLKPATAAEPSLPLSISADHNSLATGRDVNTSSGAIILGQKDVPFEKLPETLAEIAAQQREMLDRLTTLDPEDPGVKGLVEEARAAIQIGDYDRADRLLGETEADDLAAIRMAENLMRQAQETTDRRRLSAATTRAERGELSLTRLDYLDAAEHFWTAADLLPTSAVDARGDYLNRYTSVLK